MQAGRDKVATAAGMITYRRPAVIEREIVQALFCRVGPACTTTCMRKLSMLLLFEAPLPAGLACHDDVMTDQFPTGGFQLPTFDSCSLWPYRASVNRLCVRASYHSSEKSEGLGMRGGASHIVVPDVVVASESLDGGGGDRVRVIALIATGAKAAGKIAARFLVFAGFAFATSLAFAFAGLAARPEEPWKLGCDDRLLGCCDLERRVV